VYTALSVGNIISAVKWQNGKPANDDIRIMYRLTVHKNGTVIDIIQKRNSQLFRQICRTSYHLANTLMWSAI